MVSDQMRERATAYPTVLTFERCVDGVFAWVARHPDLPGCMSDGETPEEALSNLADARALYVDDLIERGLPVPQPESSSATREILRVLDQPR
jgi:predicted RNase H-like HicB family nuclease